MGSEPVVEGASAARVAYASGSVTDWLLQSSAGLLTRIVAGILIFAVLAAVDFRKHGRAATRWREYCVLLLAVVAALVYGVINDQITSTISPEYFLYFKDVVSKVGDPPSSAAAFRWEVTKIGLMATWSAGLIFGVALLLANNPWRSLPRLRNRQLVRYLPVIVLTAAAFGVVGGLIGHHGGYDHWTADFDEIVRKNQWRPRRFLACWGVHLGGYIGGLIGTVAALIGVVRRRLGIARLACRIE